MSNTIATISGVFLTPGASRNRRLYTPEVISKTVRRMQERIEDPTGLPITVRTHHEAGDDSTRIVGRIKSVTTDESGAARYKADLYDTATGRDIANLVTGDQPALRSVSIHGYWLGEVRRVSHDGQTVETADDLEVDSVDMTATPGVVGAVLDIRPSIARESTAVRTPISEAYEAKVAVPDDDMGEKGAPALKSGKDAAPQTKAKSYADPGYQDDGAKRYALDTRSQVKAAWSYINMPKNAKLYTAGQLAKVKGRIKAAAKKFGIKISDDENWLMDRGPVEEFYGDDGMATAARFCVSISNGAVDIMVSSYSVDPADLDVIARKAMDGACQALLGMDPDQDGDIDITGETAPAEGTSTRQDQPVAPTPPGTAPTEAVGESSTDLDREAPVADESTTEAAPTTAAPTTRTLTEADVNAIGQTVGAAFASALKEHMPTPAPAPAPATEPTAPTATESTTKVDEGAAVKEAVTAALEEMKTGLAKSVAETVATETGKVRDELRETLRRSGIGMARHGYRVHENDQTDPTPEQLFDNRAQVLLGDFAKTPVPHAATGWAPSATGPTAAAQ
ncbi:MAG: DUF6582 domain-containing protein [Solirubrobacteraceae bacterium]